MNPPVNDGPKNDRRTGTTDIFHYEIVPCSRRFGRPGLQVFDDQSLEDQHDEKTTQDDSGGDQVLTNGVMVVDLIQKIAHSGRMIRFNGVCKGWKVFCLKSIKSE